jgi:hypothetical protein
MHDDGVMVIRLLHVMPKGVTDFVNSSDVNEYINVFAKSGKFKKIVVGLHAMGLREYHARGIWIEVGDADNLDEICRKKLFEQWCAGFTCPDYRDSDLVWHLCNSSARHVTVTLRRVGASDPHHLAKLGADLPASPQKATPPERIGRGCGKTTALPGQSRD